jgi:uncharacterized protein YacL
MFAFLAKLVAGPLIGKVVDLVKGYQQKKLSESALRAEVEKAVLGTFSEVAKSQADIISAEMRSESWLQRNWRPTVAITFAFIPLFYGLIMPVMVSWMGFQPVRIGDDLLKWIMDVVVICLGGYIGGRSLEKIVEKIVRK